MRLYHGSPVESFKPTYGLGRDDHDYGRGFYMTVDLGVAVQKVREGAANTAGK